MSYWKIFKTLLEKDFRLEVRTREGIIAVLVFSLLSLLIFNMIMPGEKTDSAILTGIFWVVVTFSSILALDRSITRDFREKSIQGILLIPVDKSVIYLAKLTFNLFIVFFIEIATFLILTVLFNLSVGFDNAIFFLFISLLVGIGLSSSGTLYATVSQKTRSKELLLPLLFIPVVLPLLMAGINLGSAQLSGKKGVNLNWMTLILLFDFLYLALGNWLYEIMITD